MGLGAAFTAGFFASRLGAADFTTFLSAVPVKRFFAGAFFVVVAGAFFAADLLVATGLLVFTVAFVVLRCAGAFLLAAWAAFFTGVFFFELLGAIYSNVVERTNRRG